MAGYIIYIILIIVKPNYDSTFIVADAVRTLVCPCTKTPTTGVRIGIVELRRTVTSPVSGVAGTEYVMVYVIGFIEAGEIVLTLF